MPIKRILFFLLLSYGAQAQINVNVPAPNGTDDATALQNAFNAGNGSAAIVNFVANATYLTSKTVVVPSNVTIRGNNATIRALSSFVEADNIPILKIGTTTAHYTNTTATASFVNGRNWFRYTSYASITVGDMLEVNSSVAFLTTKTGNTYQQGYYGYVTGKSGDTIKLSHPAQATFSATTLHTYTPTRNVTIYDLNVLGDLLTRGDAFGFSNTRDIKVYNCKASGKAAKYNVLQQGFIVKGVGGLFDHCRAYNLKLKDTLGAVGYGFNFNGHDIVAQYSYSTDVKHGFTSGGRTFWSSGIDFMYDTSIQGLGFGGQIDFHGMTSGRMIGNIIKSTPYNEISVELRSDNIEFTDNYVEFDNRGPKGVQTVRGIWLFELAQKNITIKRNKIVMYGGDSASSIYGFNNRNDVSGATYDNVIIDSNIFIGCTINLGGSWGGGNRITNNYLKQDTRFYPFVSFSSSLVNTGQLLVDNNRFVNTATGFNYTYVSATTASAGGVLLKRNKTWLSGTGNGNTQYRLNGSGNTVTLDTVYTNNTSLVIATNYNSSVNTITANARLALVTPPPVPVWPYSSDNNTPPNTPPIVNAGVDKVITLPATSVTTSASVSDNGIISSFQWAYVSGPATYTINTPTTVNTTLSGLVQGVYKFKLTAVDDGGLSGVDTMQVTVNAAGATVIANAGADTVVLKNQSTRPDSALLSASGSVGATSYSWSVISFPTGTIAPAVSNSTASSAWLTGLKVGTTKVNLSVNGGAAFDTVTIVVRDFMLKNVTTCRAGGGVDIILPPTYSGTYIKAGGTTGRWNAWYVPDVNAYCASHSLPVSQGGDRIYLEGGADSTAFIELGNFGGASGCPVTIYPGGHPSDPAKDRLMVGKGTGWHFWLATRDSNAVVYALIDGTRLRSKGIPYSLFVDNRGNAYPANGPLSAIWVHHLEVKGIRSIKTKWLQVKVDSNKYPWSRMDKFIQRKILIHDNFIDSTAEEGMYIGNTDPDDSHGSGYGPGARMDSVEIYDNVVTNTGWDGIQLSNSRIGNRVHDNVVFNTGILTGDPSQQAGILIGANCRVQLYRNTVLRTKGDGLQVLGYGSPGVYRNYVDSSVRGDGTSSGIFVRTTPVLNDGATNAPITATLDTNIISRAEFRYVRLLANTTYPQNPGIIRLQKFIYNGTATVTGLIQNDPGSTLDRDSILGSWDVRFRGATTDSNGTVITLNFNGTNYLYKTTSISTAAAINNAIFAGPPTTNPNNPPTANAGTDRVIYQPSTTSSLTGNGTDPDGDAVTYQWILAAKPGTATDPVISAPTATTTSVTGLTSVGTYTFTFRVTDSKGAVTTDDVNVLVNADSTQANQPPVVTIGANQTITLPTDSVTLTGSATDSDGFITSVAWSQVSGPVTITFSAPAATTTIARGLLTAGKYVFRFLATDNRGATSYKQDTVTVNPVVVVNNTPPVSVPGPNQTLPFKTTSTTVNGSGSYDPDGSITTYLWTQTGGPSTATIANRNTVSTSISALGRGVYTFSLKVTDNNGATNTKSLTITVLSKQDSRAAGATIQTTSPSTQVIIQ